MKHTLKDELTDGERMRLIEIAPELESGGVLRDLSVDDFLQYCEVCYEAAGYDLGDLSPLGKYKAMADGRDDGLLDIDPVSPEALDQWFDTRPRGGHPWEIARGGNTTHISLYLHRTARRSYELILEGTAITRSAETIRMALGLRKACIPFSLRDAALHGRRAQGEDWIGIVPDHVPPWDCPSSEFPEKRQVLDCISHGEIGQYPSVTARVTWMEPELISLTNHPDKV